MATNQYGPIEAMDDPRWLLTQKANQVTIWNISGHAADPPYALLACEQPVGGDGGTARLWNLDSRQELLRFTAKAGEVVDDAVFLAVRTGNTKTRAIVTVDGSGTMQAWTSKRDPVRVKDAVKRLEKADLHGLAFDM